MIPHAIHPSTPTDFHSHHLPCSQASSYIQYMSCNKNKFNYKSDIYFINFFARTIYPHIKFNSVTCINENLFHIMELLEEMPPSTVKTTPEVYPDFSETKNAIKSEISLTCAGLDNG